MNIRGEIIVILFLIICLIFSLNTASAATNDLNNTNTTSNSNKLSLPDNNGDSIVGSGGGSFVELNNTINGGSQSNVIDLNQNYTFTNGDSAFINGIRIERALTINGHGYTIDGANQARIFDIYAPVTIINVTFINGNASASGGAIDIENAIASTIDSCTFINNTAGISGGALYWNDGAHDGIISNCKFIDNSAKYNGGVIDWHKIAENGLITNSIFTNNVAGRSGGAVYWNGHNGTIRHSKFNGNKALGINNATDSYGNNTYGGDGGAVIWIGSLGDVENCTFRENNASKRGGAVFLEGGLNIDCVDTTFTNCFPSDSKTLVNKPSTKHPQ